MRLTSPFNTTGNSVIRHGKSSLLVLSAMATLAITGCQSTTTANLPVIEKMNQTYETVGMGKNKNIARQSAISYANQTCGKKRPIVIEDDMKYNGTLGERMDKIIDKVGVVANEVLGISADLSQEDDYEYTMSFQCQ